MKKVVLVDMDGVLVDLIEIWTRIYSERTGDIRTVDSITDYYWAPSAKHPKDVHEILKFCSILHKASPLGNITKFQDLCTNPEFDVYVVTTVSETIQNGFVHKLSWLQKHCPWFDRKRVIFTAHKHLVRGDILIEDSPKNIDAWTESNPTGHAICIRAAYNTNWHPRNSTRVTTAEDVSHAVSAIFRSYL